MAIRITSGELKRIIPTTVDDTEIFEHIQIASRLVDDVFVSTTMSVNRLRDIELYLSAHLIAIRDQDAGQLREKEVGDTRASYGGEFGEALSFTRYGQMALSLDISGTLTTLGKQRAQFRAF